MMHRPINLFAFLAAGLASLVMSGCRTPEPVATPAPAATAPAAHMLLPARPDRVPASTTLPADFAPSDRIEVFGNFDTAGIIASLPEGMAAADVGRMRAYLNVAGAWAAVQDPVQVGEFAWFATSLFWLQPDSAYQVKVEVLAPDGRTLATWYGEGRTRPEPVLGTEVSTLHVATTGDDTNPGTAEQPFRSLAKALSAVGVGQTVLVQGGTYYEGGLVFNVNGQPGAPIVVRAAPGAAVIISGEDPDAMDPKAWRAEPNGLISYPCHAAYTQVCVEDLDTGRMIRLFQVPTRDELVTQRLIGKCDEYDVGGAFADLGVEGASWADGTRVHVSLPAGVTRFRMHLGKYAHGIHIEHRRHIQLAGLEFRHYGYEQPSAGVFLFASSDLLIQDCRFLYVDCQIYLKGLSDRVTIQDNYFEDAILQWPFGYMKCVAGGGPFEGGAVNVDANYSGRGLVFRRNHVKNIFDGAHLTSWLVCEARTSETDFYQNTIEDCIDDFIEIDGIARNVRVFDNYMSGSLSGISLAQALDGPTYIAYNVLANCGMVPAATREGNPGYPFKTNGGNGGISKDWHTGAVYFYHNIAHTQDPESGAMLVKFAKWRLITMRNNIWCGNKLGAEFWRKEVSPIDMDYDTLFVSKPDAPLVLQQYHTEYRTLDDVRQHFGWLRNGLSADPRLEATAAGRYTLRPDSPCIDAGTPIAGINELRTRGAAPDMGAYEAPDLPTPPAAALSRHP
jgi:hypothetical protein